MYGSVATIRGLHRFDKTSIDNVGHMGSLRFKFDDLLPHRNLHKSHEAIGT